MNKRMENGGKHVMKLNRRELRQAASEFPTLLPSTGPADERLQAEAVSRSKPTDAPLNTKFIFHMVADLQPPLVLERVPRGTRQVIATTGGQLIGPDITGKLLPGTTDWPWMRTDGVAELDTRVIVRLDDDQLLYLSYPGYFIASPEVWGRLLSGETVEPAEYYFRITPRCETGSERYGWLNLIIAVGVGEVGPGFSQVLYRVYQVL